MRFFLPLIFYVELNNTSTGKDAPTLSTLNAFLKLNPEYSMVDPASVPNPRPDPPKGGRKTILLTSVQLPPDKKARQEAAPKPPKPAPKKVVCYSQYLLLVFFIIH